MIDIAKSKAQAAGLDTIEFIHADWENFDPSIFNERRFTAIFCANTFHYFKNPHAATDRLFEQLAGDGTLYLLDRSKTRSLLTLVWGILHAILIKDQVVFYDTSELVSILKRSGFKQVRIVSTIKKYFWKNKVFTSIVLLECKKN